jgi:hypothetical protein
VSVIPALRRPMQENLKFKTNLRYKAELQASLGSVIRPCLKKKKKKKYNLIVEHLPG